MITNFEELTKPLTEDEKILLNCTYDVLKNISVNNPIKAPNLIFRVKHISNKDNFTQVRLRKMINFIRANSLLPVIATSKGYYCSFELDEIQREIDSLNERADAIRTASDGLKKFLIAEQQLRLSFE